ncbi:iduronate 2-sulfatase [Neorhodopirellula lusitana]|uniref:Iduronate 2-sulfatase n=2 Tax=Neorhodopirellula lusitana TaxID=445327 RepID=A0ABY1QCG5_9BACT|nr:sulfatase [Neorhodopirellula lusitana]SMP67286.1 iduronate 2-sulfatase [Neorhodopirellula lusitana]
MQRFYVQMVAAFAFVACCQVPGYSATRPNVLFIAVDDLRPSIGCYGDTQAITPNMDRLASRSVLFNRAYCQVAVCNPSRASLMTGMRPDKLGVWTLPIHFREAMPDVVTMPQWFRKFGYTAVSHGKIYHNPTPDPQSWSEPIRDLPPLPYVYPEGTRSQIKKAQDALPDNDWRKNNLRGPSTASPNLADDQVLDGARTNMAIEDLRRLGKQDDPFFLAMGYIRPHLAWVAPKKYWDMHDPAKLPVLGEQHTPTDAPAYSMHNNSELTHYVDLIKLPRPWDDRDVDTEHARHLMHGYYACVSYVDAQIGRLLDVLDEEGLADNTIVVLWSDHGWKLGEHRGWGKMTNYEIDARVPLLIAGPGVDRAGEKTEGLAELLDLFPTLCEMANIEVPDFVDGASLVPILQNVDAQVHDGAVNQYYRRLNGNQYMGYSIRTNDYRFVEWRDFSTGEVTVKELYDHRTEHSETVNIVDSVDAGVVNELTALLLESHPRKGLVMRPKIHSAPQANGGQGELSFENKTDTPIRVHLVAPSGKRDRGRKVAPQGEVTMKQKMGSVYVVESLDGTIHEIHPLSKPVETVVIERD